MNKIIKCPVCSEQIQKCEKTYKCSNGHSFDIAKEGYVNFVLANQKNSKAPGDNKEMMIARRNFLNTNAYYPLVSSIINTLKTILHDSATIVEAGCGEGYYISNVKDAFPKTKAYGFDVSKDAVKMACKRNKDVNFFVSSSYESNIKDNSIDAIMVVFAPFAEEEFYRILSRFGHIVLVRPKFDHLIEIKNQIYSQIKPTPVQNYKKFEVFKTINVSYNIYPNQEELESLLKMTPFYYQIREEDRSKLDFSIGKNGIKASFIIEVLKK